MAEYSFVYDIANSLLGKLASHAYEEASRACGVYEDLQGIKDTLSIVRGVLLDGEEKKDQKHGLREWLRQIRNICSDAEDVLDEVECQNLRNQFVKASDSKRVKVRHFVSSSNPLVFRFRMLYQIKDVRNRLDKVAADGIKFGLARIDADPSLLLQRREMTYSHVDSSDVIGRENDREEIIKLLMEQLQPHPDDGYQSLCVIPIVGIGGMGKTTLAKLVFNDTRMDEIFQLKLWVCFSNDFDIRQIIIKIINSASASVSTLAHQESINHLDIDQLVTRLRYKLSGQKFLLVLDDVWNDDRAKWIELKSLIKVGAVGSKIIVTTRSNSIASKMGTVPPYVLENLSPENCLSLFIRWAFKEGEEIKYQNLMEVGKEIVKKCRGIPLAVKTLGSSLFSKFDLDKWKFVRDSEIWNLRQDKDDILPVLKLSYDQMPSHLRHCFAFFSLYPKNHLFTCDEIGNLWGVLGLVQSLDGSQKLENIAREYIDELQSRTFLQDFEDFGHMCFFKLHDLVHDLAMYVANEEFVVVNSHIRNRFEQAKHLSIVENVSLDHTLFPKSRSVRTILFPIDGLGVDSETLLETWVSRYKYLRYLDLSDSSFETLPNSIAKLVHLRVLILSCNNKIKGLPHSICELQNLQILSLRGCRELETLPKGLGKLINLQQLFITTKQPILLENEFASLNHLRTLGFHYCNNLKFLVSGEQLTSLETLFVQSCGSLESLPLYIFPKLQTLFIAECKILNLSLNNEFPFTNPLNDDSPIANSQMLQQSMNHKSSIQRLRMKHLYLGNFPGLVALPRWIVGAADTLHSLVIKSFPSLRMLPEYLTTMTQLKRLHIVDCPQLLTLPSDMHHLTALEDLSIDGCPDLCRKCHLQSGEYRPMIAHVKRVFIGEPRGEEK